MKYYKFVDADGSISRIRDDEWYEAGDSLEWSSFPVMIIEITKKEYEDDNG